MKNKGIVMTIGVGGKSKENELERLKGLVSADPEVTKTHLEKRIQRLSDIMAKNNVSHLFLHAGSNLLYFTGIRWNPSERLVGAVIDNKGGVHYILPKFEQGTFDNLIKVDGDKHFWEEHECPIALLLNVVGNNGALALDNSMAYGTALAITEKADCVKISSAEPHILALRSCKTEIEIASLQKAKDMTLEVHKSTAAILHEGISTKEVNEFINEAHKAIGAPAGSYFCIVLFGEATSFPHGVNYEQYLKEGDMVLIDTGCVINNYKSDITRSYVFGEPTDRHREIWNVEKEAQVAAFNAAKNGIPCEDVDEAARGVIASYGFGPEYQLPGLPHRTGHGIGLDIHEGPYLVKGEKTILASGMCFSNEPMMVVPGEFGVRLEDHFYMTDHGPKWFTEPSYSIDDPFGFKE